MNTFFSSTFNRLLGSILMAMVISALAAYAIFTMRSADLVKEYPTAISVTGEGKVMVKPDVTQFSFSVTAKGATAEEAQATSSTKMAALTKYLSEQGIAEADIKTENYSLYPLFTYDYSIEMTCDDWGCPPPTEIPDGFEVSQYVTVKARDMAKAGTLLAGVGGLGATNISGLSFIIDDVEPSKDEARNKAIADARAEGQNIATQFGMTLTRMTGYYETEDYYSEPSYSSYEMDMAKGESYGAPTPVVPAGEQEITSTVNVTYEIE
jgi:uncharacterized protein